jgi:hypothetical protein
MNAAVNGYKSVAWTHRIEASLANISVKPEDKFQLVKAYYDVHEFDCELCGHKHCMYAFEVKNLESNIIIKVGSECIHHFAGKGVDINLAEGLMERVMKASVKARSDLKVSLGEKAWLEIPEEERNKISYWKRNDYKKELGLAAYKALSKDKKRELITEQYMIVQAKELLSDVAYNRSILSPEEVSMIAELGMTVELEKAQEKQKQMVMRQEMKELEGQFFQGINSEDFAKAKEALDAIKVKCPEYSNLENLQYRYDNDFNAFQKVQNTYGWLMAYAGKNPIVLSIKLYLKRYGDISDKQESYAKSLIKQEALG